MRADGSVVDWGQQLKDAWDISEGAALACMDRFLSEGDSPLLLRSRRCVLLVHKSAYVSGHVECVEYRMSKQHCVSSPEDVRLT